MKTSIIVLILTVNIMASRAQSHDMVREPAVAGSFYPGTEKQLKTDINKYLSGSPGQIKDGIVRAIISPHAGYVFSGSVAGAAYSSIPGGASYKNIFIIGSSHRVSFPGASVISGGKYKTPIGNARINGSIASALITGNKIFSYVKQAHTTEHSIEVQVPFIQTKFGADASIVPIIIGCQDRESLKKIASALKPYFTTDNLFVISSDFSHYPEYSVAKNIDSKTSEAFRTGDTDTFYNYLRKNSKTEPAGVVTRMCGWTSGMVLLYLTEGDTTLSFRQILYKNSGDSPMGDRSSVVGYNAIAVTGPLNSTTGQNEQNESFSLTKDEQEILLQIARENIRSRLYDNRSSDIEPSDYPASLNEHLGAFVTLNIDGKLRGCIGRFMPDEPLCMVVRDMSSAAAFNDSRFMPLTKKEFEKVSIEISVLGPMKKIDDIKEITLGKHGVYIRKGYKSGTFLPQVADGQDWTVEQFLGYISRDKAGLGWSGWKDADIYIYEAFVFSEAH